MEKKQVEILAPAGSWGSMKAAIAAGADAVYMGGSRFGARAYADNTDERGMVEAIEYAHLHGRRLYMTVNTLFKEQELNELTDYMKPYYLAGLDGVIIQDLGALRVLKAGFPGLELHASTQMTITSVYGAKMMKALGCSRVVTSRELSLEEIRRIHHEVDVEIESFVHGALCYCYSGQCLMSSLIGGRSGNRGRCAQPCRLPYSVYEDGQPQKPVNREKERYVLSLKDLCTLDILPDIIEAGVYSLKIEGRMKSPRYTAGVVRIYRKYADLYLEQGREGYRVASEDKKELLDLFDRGGFTSGYYGAHNGREMVALKEKPEFREGNQRLFDFLDKTYVEAEVKETAEGVVTLEQGSPSRLTLMSRGVRVTVEGQAPEAARKQPVTAEKVEKQINKTGGTPFVFTRLTTDIKGELFLPVQALNELRRTGLEALEEAILDQRRRKITGHGTMEMPVQTDGSRERDLKDTPNMGMGSGSAASRGTEGAAASDSSLLLTASLELPSQLSPALACRELSAVYIDAGSFQPKSWKETADRCHKAEKLCCLMLPRIFREHAIDFFNKNKDLLKAASFDGVVVRALEEAQWLRDEGIRLPLILDASVYGWNSRAVELLAQISAQASEPGSPQATSQHSSQASEPGSPQATSQHSAQAPAPGSLQDIITLPLELNSREMEPVLAACAALGKPAELIVYGHAPMMVSAQCITRTVKGCSSRPAVMMMKDRTGAMLPVKNHCVFCYNTIYNPSPTSLLGNEQLVRRLGVNRVRLSFTLEDGKETEALLEAFSNAFLHGEKVAAPYKEFTRGHFKRGVE